MKKMSNSNTTQETLEIMKESEKKLVEESVNKNKFIFFLSNLEAFYIYMPFKVNPMAA